MAFVLRALKAQNKHRDDADADDRKEQMNWDLNADLKLDKDEMRGMKRADKARYLRFLKADRDGDGQLDEDELQVAEDGERRYHSILTLRKLKVFLKERISVDGCSDEFRKLNLSTVIHIYQLKNTVDFILSEVAIKLFISYKQFFIL